MDPHGESAAATIQRFESRVQRAAAGIRVGVVQVPEDCDSRRFQ
jgi:hypothetical protein